MYNDKAKKVFLMNHNIFGLNSLNTYRSLVAVYDLYLIEAMRFTVDLQDGLIFDKYEAAIVFHSLIMSHEILKELREELHMNGKFDIHQVVQFKEGKLEDGYMKGDKKFAIESAKKWMDRYHRNAENTFLYEASVYTLLVNEEDYYLNLK